jgi:hypothetical protein
MTSVLQKNRTLELMEPETILDTPVFTQAQEAIASGPPSRQMSQVWKVMAWNMPRCAHEASEEYCGRSVM